MVQRLNRILSLYKFMVGSVAFCGCSKFRKCPEKEKSEESEKLDLKCIIGNYTVEILFHGML